MRERRLPIGAEVSGDGVHFRVWAPRRKNVDVAFESDSIEPLKLKAEAGGYFAGVAPEAKAGTLYRFRLDGADKLLPDPASRFQPDGVHGPSQVIDPAAFKWTDADWPGVGPAGVVLYEMHVGTFTREGTWESAMRELRSLADVGVNCLEVMPVCDFGGRFGWGYDGVDFFAPTRLYGTPDDFRRFVNEAHKLGIGVILDVVYNHFGPAGNYLPEFSIDYASTKHKTDWGGAVNFDGENSGGVREFFIANARYWVEEFHVDGYRYDATQAIVDDSPVHILAEISEAARKAARPGRKVYLVNENEPQHTRLVRPIHAGGYGMDALWNDDFHHSAMVAVTGRNEAYYTDHLGRPQEFISVAKYGYLFQGQRYSWQKKRRGTPGMDLPPTAFVNFIQNHDQIANTGMGHRVYELTSPGEFRAMTALMLLSPQTPMLFQGQEWAASGPFNYFADHPELSELICKGRAKEMSQFPSLATPEAQAALANPCKEETFLRCKLDHSEKTRGHHAQVYALHKDLLKLRREEPTMRRVQRRGDVDGAVLDAKAFVLRYFGEDGDDRLLVVNFGTDLHLGIAPEPLLAPPGDMRWAVLWSSEHPKYGGSGTPPPDTECEGWFLPGRAAVVLKPISEKDGKVETRCK